MSVTLCSGGSRGPDRPSGDSNLRKQELRANMSRVHVGVHVLYLHICCSSIHLRFHVSGGKAL